MVCAWCARCAWMCVEVGGVGALTAYGCGSDARDWSFRRWCTDVHKRVCSVFLDVVLSGAASSLVFTDTIWGLMVAFFRSLGGGASKTAIFDALRSSSGRFSWRCDLGVAVIFRCSMGVDGPGFAVYATKAGGTGFASVQRTAVQLLLAGRFGLAFQESKPRAWSV